MFQHLSASLVANLLIAAQWRRFYCTAIWCAWSSIKKRKPQIGGSVIPRNRVRGLKQLLRVDFQLKALGEVYWGRLLLRVIGKASMFN